MRQDFDDGFVGVLTETISLHKCDGSVFENIRCRFASKGPRMIFVIDDVTLPIEAGDKLVRALPSGLLEEFLVDDPVYVASVHGLPAHFQVRVHRAAGGRRSASAAEWPGGRADPQTLGGGGIPSGFKSVTPTVTAQLDFPATRYRFQGGPSSQSHRDGLY